MGRHMVFHVTNPDCEVIGDQEIQEVKEGLSDMLDLLNRNQFPESQVFAAMPPTKHGFCVEARLDAVGDVQK